MQNKLVVGLTTCPRDIPTIDRTVQSLRKSGFDIHVFAEPNSLVPKNIRVSRRKERRGAWENWFFGLKELYETYQQPWYIMVQDDIILCRNLCEFALSVAGDGDCYSFFTPQQYAGRLGWNEIKEGANLWMAQMYMFPQHVVSALLHSNEIWRIPGQSSIDNRIGLWAKYNNKKVYYHTPSLVKHIGHTSSIWPKAVLEGGRTEVNFPGEDFDAMLLDQQALHT